MDFYVQFNFFSFLKCILCVAHLAMQSEFVYVLHWFGTGFWVTKVTVYEI